MTQGIFSNTLLAIGTLFFALVPQTPQTANKPVIPAPIQEVFYVVEENESLTTIADTVYGNPEYWTVLWNDNPWIENPYFIYTGRKLKLRNENPLLVEKLKPELLAKAGEMTYTTFYVQSVSVQYIPETNDVVFITPVPTVVPTVQPTSAPAIAPQPASGPLSEAQITFLGNCESGMNPTTNTGNGFYGAFQFMISTWNSMGTGYERADFAPLEVQKDAVQRLLTRSSIWTQFPGCAQKMRNAGLI